MNLSRKLCFTLIPILIAGCAANQNKVKHNDRVYSYNGEAPFVNASSIKKAVRDQCNLNENLAHAVSAHAEKYGISLEDSSGPKRQLSVEITQAYPGIFVFGNFGSVPARLGVKFQVKEGDKVIYERDRSCKTNLAGFLGLAPSACNKLNKCAENQAEYIARKLNNLR